MTRPAPSPERGFSLIELAVVLAIFGVVAAIAVPAVLRARRDADLRGALDALFTTALSRAERSRGGPDETLAAAGLAVPATVAINPRGVAPPPGATLVSAVTFRGGHVVGPLGYTPALVVADTADPSRAFAVCVGRSGTVTQWVYAGRTWKEIER